MPLDNIIRLFDCLGSLPKIEFFSINQLGLEREIHQKQASPQSKSIGDVAQQSEPISLQPLDQAAMRFFEGMEKNALSTGRHEDIWVLAADEGIPFAVSSKNFWYNFRQHWFTRTRVKEDLSQYGEDRAKIDQNFAEHGARDGWRKLLDKFLDEQVAIPDEARSKVFLRSSTLGWNWLKAFVKGPALEAFLVLPGVEDKADEDAE